MGESRVDERGLSNVVLSIGALASSVQFELVPPRIERVSGKNVVNAHKLYIVLKTKQQEKVLSK